MPSLRLDKFILGSSVVALVSLALFYAHLIVTATQFFPTVGPQLVQGAASLLIGIILHRIYKIINETNDIKTDSFKNEVMHGIGEVDCKVTKMDCRLERVEEAVERANIYSDVKKRRWAEFDSDWVAVRKNFERLNNNDIYAFGRIVKDTLREYAHEITLSDLTGDPKEIQDFMAERGRAYTEDLMIRARQMLPADYIEFFRTENGDNRKVFIAAIHDLLTRDKINNRAEKIHLLARQFLGRCHNTIYLSWKEWSLAHKDVLAVDPVERYFKKPADEKKEDAAYRKHELAHQ